MAESLGFDETDAGRAALVAMELATNILKHAQRGVFKVQPVSADGGRGVEMIASDKGEGFDFARLPPKARVIFVRQTVSDWTVEQPTPMLIERIDRPTPPFRRPSA